jgi:hypothetical protein
MNRTTLRALLAAGVLSGPMLTAGPATKSASAVEYAWCAVYRSGSENCGFVSFDQCSSQISAVGGFCRQSNWPAAGQARGRR